MRYRSQNKNLTSDALSEARDLLDLGIKKCTACGALKAVTLFQSAKLGLGGLASECKDCAADRQRKHRFAKKLFDVVFSVNRAILKRQMANTHVCWLVDKAAHVAASHLSDEYGLLSVADAHKFGSIFKNNLPEKTQAIEEKARMTRERRELQAAERANAREKKAAEKEAMRVATKAHNAQIFKTKVVTDAQKDAVVYEKLRCHLKGKRRKLKITDFSFTKANFACLTGYSVTELREYMEQQIPVGKSWIDVFSGELHLEHILPASAFDLTTLVGIRACYALSNLTWLDGVANSVKGVHVDRDTIRHFRDDPESARLFGLVE